MDIPSVKTGQKLFISSMYTLKAYNCILYLIIYVGVFAYGT